MITSVRICFVRVSDPILFSYVVDHDLGFAPNPYGGYCTLVHCKFGGLGRRQNIVEMGTPGDWILGTGGVGKDSAGHGRIIYLMRVDEKLTFTEYLVNRRFQRRLDCKDLGSGNLFALVSRTYFYFGKNAMEISKLPQGLAAGLVKSGPGFRRDYPVASLMELVTWFNERFENGLHGEPCGAPLKKCRRGKGDE
jgi:Nucleotide modification associated domain 2